MDIEIIARFSREKQLSKEDIEDDYVNQLIGKALKPPTVKMEYFYEPVVFNSDDIKAFTRVDDKHTQIILKGEQLHYNAFVPYEHWIQVYQQITHQMIMKVAFTMAPEPKKKRVSVKE